MLNYHCCTFHSVFSMSGNLFSLLAPRTSFGIVDGWFSSHTMSLYRPRIWEPPGNSIVMVISSYYLYTSFKEISLYFLLIICFENETGFLLCLPVYVSIYLPRFSVLSLYLSTPLSTCLPRMMMCWFLNMSPNSSGIKISHIFSLFCLLLTLKKCPFPKIIFW